MDAPDPLNGCVRQPAGEIPAMVRVDLKVLRGRGLVARDASYVTEASPDPYCVILIDDEEMGKTDVVHGTLNPVWSKSNSFGDIPVAPMSVLTVRLLDKGVMSNDDPMGEVRVVIGDWITSRHTPSPGSPNRWYQVVPTNGCQCSGKLELRILLDSERVRPHAECGDRDPRRILRDGRIKPQSMGRLTAHREVIREPWDLSSFVWGHPETAVVDHIARATTPVLLHIYDVGHSSWIAGLNCTTGAIGGVFHGGIEVHGREFSFGGCRQRSQCGIFPCKPRGCVLHTYRETIYLGDCQLGRSHVSSILRLMREEWPGLSYDMLRKNCCHFCNEFAIELGVGEIPERTHRFAGVIAALHDAIRGGQGPIDANREPSTQDEKEQRENEEIQEHLLEHVMADRIQTIARMRSGRRHRLMGEAS